MVEADAYLKKFQKELSAGWPCWPAPANRCTAT